MIDDETFYRQCRTLLDRFGDRLGDEVVSVLQSDARAGEWDELLDNVVAGLVQKQAPVTAAERDELAALVEKANMDLTNPLDELTVQ